MVLGLSPLFGLSVIVSGRSVPVRLLSALRDPLQLEMPPKKQKRPASSSDSDSGPDDKGPIEKKPAKSQSKSGSGPKANDGEQHFLIEKTKFATVREFRGTTYVDIREYYEKDGELLPGRKGISLTATQYQKFKDLIPELDVALKNH